MVYSNSKYDRSKANQVSQKFREIEAKTEQNCPKLHRIERRIKIIIPKSRINRNRLYLPKIEAKAYLIDLPKLLAYVDDVNLFHLFNKRIAK